jgi:hypothetical protein
MLPNCDKTETKPFIVTIQRHAFYKRVPKNHEQARNIMADCKTSKGRTLILEMRA